METIAAIPMGKIRIVEPSGRLAAGDSVSIPQYGLIYSALGGTREMFEKWERENGLDSPGVGIDGALLLPHFPIFSKVAWTYIDHVDLSLEETKMLVGECEEALKGLDQPGPRNLFIAIRNLALTALERSAGLRFGPP
jgi:hypothetical protein